MGGAASILSRPRVAAFAAVAAFLAVYYATSGSLWDAGVWWDVAWISAVLIPAVFGLIFLALPAVRGHRLLAVAGAGGAVAAVAEVTGAEAVANFGKLAGVGALGVWLVVVIESLALIVLVACVIPWVDAWSVWRGPTEEIVEERPDVFEDLSIAYPVPGEHGSANLGLPDVLFFALFLETCRRHGLRTGWTWLGMTASFGIVLALAVWLDLSGLPALPGLSIAFLGANADLLWRRWREYRAARATQAPPELPL